MTEKKHVTEGENVRCPRCAEEHELKCVISPLTGKRTPSLMFIECRGRKLLAAVDKRLVEGMPDVTRTI